MKKVMAWVLTLCLLCSAVPALGTPEMIGDYFEGRAAFSENGKWGFLDEKGQVTVPAAYDSIRVYEDGYARVSKWVGERELWGLLDLAGKEVLPLRYDWIGDLSEGLRKISLDGKYGYMDENFRLVVKHQYDEAEDFENGCAQVGRYDENKTPMRGLIAPTGESVVPCAYASIGIENGLALVATWEETYGAVSMETGEEVYPSRFRTREALKAAMAAGSTDPDVLWKRTMAAEKAAGLEVTWYPEYKNLTRCYGTDRMLLQKNGLFGLFDLRGNAVTDFVFDAVGEFGENGVAAAMKNGKWGKIDLDGKTVINFVYDTEQETKEPVSAKVVRKGGTFAVADLSGKLLTGYKYWNAKPFVNGYAAVQNDRRNWGFVDQTGTEAVPCRYYADISGISDVGDDGFAIIDGWDVNAAVYVAADQELKPGGSNWFWRAGQGLWGFVNRDNQVGFSDSRGTVVIQPQYDYRETNSPRDSRMIGNYFSEDGVAAVYPKNSDEVIYIDTAGKVLENYDPDVAVPYGYGEGLQWSENAEHIWGFADESENVVVPYLYDAVGWFDHEYASVRVDGIYGMLKNPLSADQPSAWAAGEVTAAREAGYITPRCDGGFTADITRLQFAELAVNYLEKATGKPVETEKENPFTDTETETALKAYAVGIVRGKGEGVFAPDDLLTRQELATMLYRTMEKAGVVFDQPALDFAAYGDGALVADWAKEALAALVAGGVLKGTGDGKLSPTNSCTVEQAILQVYRAAK